MDLPTCPACKQSVLDEDAVECPFCGAPMKGGAGTARPGSLAKTPASKSPSARPGTSSPGTAKPGTSKTGSSAEIASRGKSGDEAATGTAEDDPFAVDPSIAAGAIPVSRQPGPSKPLEVVCPMCETKGFVSLKAAGKHVKCCNPQCMVPIFTAPAPEKKEVVAPPPKPKTKIPPLYIGAVVVVLALGAFFVYLKMQPEPVTQFDPIVTGEYKSTPGPNDQTANDQKNAGQAGTADGKTQDALDPEKVRQQIVQEALLRMLEVNPKVENQRRQTWRRLAITAYLYAGSEKDAGDQMNQIKKQNPQYEGVLPVVVKAWRNASNPAEFQKAVADAQQLAEQLPPRGRYATEAAISTAVLLVVSGKPDDARQLLAKHPSEDSIEQLAAELRVVCEDETFNLDATLIGQTLEDWQKPMETAVTLILAAHGRWDDALAWSTQIEDRSGKNESLTVWAESFVRHNVPVEDANGWERAAKAGQDLPVAGKARLLARLAAVKLSKGDRPGAEALILQADQALKTLPDDKPLRVASVKEVYDLKLDPQQAIPLRQAALAATEIAGVQAQLGDTTTAWKSIQKALQFLRAIGPSMSAMQERRTQYDANQGAVQKELERELGVRKTEDQRVALKRYKERLQDAEAAAATRFYGLSLVLKAAANYGLLDQVWEELQAIDRRPAKDKEPLLNTALPLLVAARYDAAGNPQKKEEIVELVQPRINPADPEVVEQNVEQLLKAGDTAASVKQLNKAMNPHGTLHEFTLRAACRLVNQGKITEAISFCSSIKDQTIREDGLYLTAALAARTGKGEEYWKSVGGLGAMETSAVCSGLVVGFTSGPPAAK